MTRTPSKTGKARKPRDSKITMNTPCKKAGQVRYVVKTGKSAGAIRCKNAPSTGPRKRSAANPALASKPCKPNKAGIHDKARQQSAPYRCVKIGGRTHVTRSGDAGVCFDKIKARADGKQQTVHYVANPAFGKVKGARRCIVAGKYRNASGKRVSAAKGGSKVCAPGQVLKTYVPTKGHFKGQTIKRCVQSKVVTDCPANKFLAKKGAKGKPRCVTARALGPVKVSKTGKSKTGGYTLIAQGSQPVLFKSASRGPGARTQRRGFRMQRNSRKYAGMPASAISNLNALNTISNLNALIAKTKAARAAGAYKRAAQSIRKPAAKKPAAKKAAKKRAASPKANKPAGKRQRKAPQRLGF